MVRRILLVLAGLAVAVAAGYGGYWLAMPHLQPHPPVVATRATQTCSFKGTALHDLSGHLPDVSAYRGHVVLLNFWASWCKPCRHEMPALEDIAKRYAPQGVRIVGVAVDDPTRAQKFAQKIGITYPLLYGKSAADDLLQACSAGEQGLPMSVVLNRQGKVCASHAGALDAQGFSSLLHSCMAP